MKFCVYGVSSNFRGFYFFLGGGAFKSINIENSLNYVRIAMLLNIDDSCLCLQYALSVEPLRYILIMYITTNVLVACLFVTFFH